MKKIIDWFKTLDARELTLMALGLILIVGIGFFLRINNLLVKERNYARGLVIEKSKNLVLIDSLEKVNVEIVYQRDILIRQKDELQKRYGYLKAQMAVVTNRVNKITKTGYVDYRNARVLQSELERHRKYVFLTDKIEN
jgi:hypothetical protein